MNFSKGCYNIFFAAYSGPVRFASIRMNTLKVKSRLSELDKVRHFFQKSLAGCSLSEEKSYIIELSLLEICINIIRYAYPRDKGDIFLKSWFEDDKVFFEIKDNGIPFDPRTAEKPDIHKMIKAKKTGGLGVHLFRELMDGFDYKRENDQNVITISKSISA